jgi:hypothetical protein
MAMTEVRIPDRAYAVGSCILQDAELFSHLCSARMKNKSQVYIDISTCKTCGDTHLLEQGLLHTFVQK